MILKRRTYGYCLCLFYKSISIMMEELETFMLYLIFGFLLIIFGGTIISKGFQVQSMWILVLLFLKALAFGGIEEIGWRYTFQPVMERMVTYIPAVYGFVL